MENELIKSIGAVLKMLRIVNGLSQKEICQKIGISISFLSAIENGKQKSDLKMLEAYSEALNIKKSDIILSAEEFIANEFSYPKKMSILLERTARL